MSKSIVILTKTLAQAGDVQKFLNEEGFHVKVYTNKTDLVNTFDPQSQILLVLDFDGSFTIDLQYLETLRKKGSSFPIYIYSNQTDIKHLAELSLLGISHICRPAKEYSGLLDFLKPLVGDQSAQADNSKSHTAFLDFATKMPSAKYLPNLTAQNKELFNQLHGALQRCNNVFIIAPNSIELPAIAQESGALKKVRAKNVQVLGYHHFTQKAQNKELEEYIKNPSLLLLKDFNPNEDLDAFKEFAKEIEGSKSGLVIQVSPQDYEQSNEGVKGLINKNSIKWPALHERSADALWHLQSMLKNSPYALEELGPKTQYALLDPTFSISYKLLEEIAQLLLDEKPVTVNTLIELTQNESINTELPETLPTLAQYLKQKSSKDEEEAREETFGAKLLEIQETAS